MTDVRSMALSGGCGSQVTSSTCEQLEPSIPRCAAGEGGAQFPHFADCTRSDAEGLDGLHLLVWAAEAWGHWPSDGSAEFLGAMSTGTWPELGAFCIVPGQ